MCAESTYDHMLDLYVVDINTDVYHAYPVVSRVTLKVSELTMANGLPFKHI